MSDNYQKQTKDTIIIADEKDLEQMFPQLDSIARSTTVELQDIRQSEMSNRILMEENSMIKTTHINSINQSNLDSKVESAEDDIEAYEFDLNKQTDCRVILKNLIRDRNLKQLNETLAKLSNEMILSFP